MSNSAARKHGKKKRGHAHEQHGYALSTFHWLLMSYQDSPRHNKCTPEFRLAVVALVCVRRVACLKLPAQEGRREFHWEMGSRFHWVTQRNLKIKSWNLWKSSMDRIDTLLTLLAFSFFRSSFIELYLKFRLSDCIIWCEYNIDSFLIFHLVHKLLNVASHSVAATARI